MYIWRERGERKPGQEVRCWGRAWYSKGGGLFIWGGFPPKEGLIKEGRKAISINSNTHIFVYFCLLLLSGKSKAF